MSAAPLRSNARPAAAPTSAPQRATHLRAWRGAVTARK